MVVKKAPPSLHALSLQSLCQTMLQQWKNTYFTNYLGYSEHFMNALSVSIPPTIHDQVFEVMVDYHARFIQKEKTFIPCISALVNSIISPKLHKLNLGSLRHIGIVQDEELEFLQDMLVCKLPYLDNLVEISLQTSGTDFTLPTCTDEILKVIGSTCYKLTNLDISYNHEVTDNGLRSLIPSEQQNGCPKLVKVWVFECSITHRGIAMLLQGLRKLKFLGYRETVECLKVLNYMSLSHRHKVQPLELAHINNLGSLSRTCKTFKKLQCNSTTIDTISKLCPKLNALKVRVNDPLVMLLCKLTSVTILELNYDFGNRSSPGSNTVQFFQLCGVQFVQLTFVCDIFSTQDLKVICEHCHNLKCLFINSNNFNCDKDITISDKRKCALTNLQEFQFKIGYDIKELSHVPLNILSYVLHKTNILTKFGLFMRNALLSDAYIADLFSSIETSKIKRVELVVPCDLLLLPLCLSMVTVDTLIEMCPELEELGNLLVWDVSLEEIAELRSRLQFTNSALVLV